MSQNYYAEGAVHNDQHKEINISGNVTEGTLSRLVQSFMADAEEMEEATSTEQPAPKENPSSSNAEDRLCVALNSHHREVLYHAEQQGIIRYIASRKGYERGETSSNALVAYLCGRLFCGDSTNREGRWVSGSKFDDAKYCRELFGFDVAGTRRSTQGNGAGKSPIGYERVDKLFE